MSSPALRPFSSCCCSPQVPSRYCASGRRGPRLHLPRHGSAGAVARRHDARKCRTRWSTRSSASCRRRRAWTSCAPTRGPASATSSSTSRARCAARPSTMPSTRCARRSATSAQTLPEGVIGPFFNDEFGDTYISLYALTGHGYSYPELKKFAKNARDMLLRIPGVAKVDLLGTPGGAHLHRGVVGGAGRARSLRTRHCRPRSPARTRWTPRAASRPASARCASTSRVGSGRSRISASCGCAPASRRSGSAISPRSSARWRIRRPPRPATRARRRCCSAPPWRPAATSRRSAPRWSGRSRASSRSCRSASSSAGSPTRRRS